MASAQDIRELLLRYVSGEIIASDFANRCAPIIRESIKSHDASAKRLSLAVHAQVSHYFNGLVPEGEFISNLRNLSEEPVNIVIGVPSVNLSVNRYQVIEKAFPASFGFFDTSREAELGSVQSSQV